MAKKPEVNKTQAVRDYLKDHPKAMSSEIAAALTKQGIKINAGYVAGIKTKINKKAATKKAVKKSAVAASAVVDKLTSNSDTITLEQIKSVAKAISAIGGIYRVFDVLDVIKELGGVKKFKELAEAISAINSDDIPF